ncbi:MAG: hypothetical protein ACRCT7_12115, partial [Shewanella sp.]
WVKIAMGSNSSSMKVALNGKQNIVKLKLSAIHLKKCHLGKMQTAAKFGRIVLNLEFSFFVFDIITNINLAHRQKNPS